MWWKRRKTRLVTLYGKPGCHLCEEARTLLEALARRYPMKLVEIDITRDAQTYREYDIRIPVVEIDGRQVLEAPIEERALRVALSLSRP